MFINSACCCLSLASGIKDLHPKKLAKQKTQDIPGTHAHTRPKVVDSLTCQSPVASDVCHSNPRRRGMRSRMSRWTGWIVRGGGMTLDSVPTQVLASSQRFAIWPPSSSMVKQSSALFVPDNSYW